jgi:hypothetical protein
MRYSRWLYCISRTNARLPYGLAGSLHIGCKGRLPLHLQGGSRYDGSPITNHLELNLWKISYLLG